MPYKNINKRREYRNRWYRNNKESEKRYAKKQKERIKKWYMEYKKTLKCQRCPESDPICLDFHHKRNNKGKEISIMASHGYSIKSIIKEISKCLVLCSNCHRKEHDKKR